MSIAGGGFDITGSAGGTAAAAAAAAAASMRSGKVEPNPAALLQAIDEALIDAASESSPRFFNQILMAHLPLLINPLAVKVG
mgnify:CR=1 FL=1